MRCRTILRCLGVLFGLAAAGSTPLVAAGRVWFGGGLGLGFGNVDYVSVEPLVGYDVRPDLSVGGGLIYRHTNDGRFSPKLRTSDYGANAFMRYRVFEPMFLQAEYEHLRYESSFGGAKDRGSFDSLLGGVGFATPIGGRASFFALTLYNFSYDDGDPRSPYSNPWIYRVGVSIGF